MNLVLADTEEFRRVKRRQDRSAPGAGGSVVESEEKRTLGLAIVRGAYIVSLSVESPPPADPSARLGKSAPGGIASALSAGPGVAKPAWPRRPRSLPRCKTYSVLTRQTEVTLLMFSRALLLASVVVLLQACPASPARLLALLVVAVSGRNADTVATACLTTIVQAPHSSLADSLLLPVSRALLPEASLLTASSLLPAAARLASTPVLDDRIYSCMSIRMDQGSAIGL